MKLRQLKISNIMSFPYVEDFEHLEGIKFEEKEGGDMNILIGANGSGKSNFIEIINQFTRTLILDYTFDKTILEQQLTKKYPEAIQLLLKKTSRLNKNINTQDLPAQIEIKLELFDNDFENIGFVCKYTDKINTIIKKYSSIKYRFPQYTIEKVQEQCKNLTMYAEFSEKEQTFIINQNLLSPIEFFALICIQEQELLHICIKIFNDFEKKAEERFWYPLKNTFSIISSKRTLNKRNFLSDFHEFDSYIFQEKKDDEQNLDGFYRTIHKIWSIINKNSQEILLREKEIEGNIEERLYNSVFWKTLSKNIKRFINKNIFIDYIQGGISIRFSNENGDIYALEDLSDGEQSILIILFSIHGNDLKNGLMIIDEPELHCHPQIQKEFAFLLNNLSKLHNTQFFISTYSALFINENNITNVYRFSKEENKSSIFNPKLAIASDDAKLVHLLRYENLSKIFFVNKIIMVEGDSDLYFFSNYLRYFQEQPEREDIIGTYEIININGKGSYKSWNKFLNKFGIKNYFIGDRDNTVDYGFFTQQELGKYYQLANKHLKYYQEDSGDYYNRLVFAIKKYYPQKFKRVINGIQNLYKQQIYILKLGAIESYPGLERKGLQYMVSFCNYEFNERLDNPKYQQQRKELEDIFSHIFSKKKAE